MVIPSPMALPFPESPLLMHAFLTEAGAKNFHSAHPMRDVARHRQGMIVTGGIGVVTTVLELVATSIGFGIVVMGFLTSCLGMLSGWTRKEWEDEAVRTAFVGGLAGIFCLCLDLIVRYWG
jgi:ABC-type antimicrobial peptide transport system permease subunit